RAGPGVHRRLPRPLPARAGLHRPDGRAGAPRRLRDLAARPPPARPRDPRRREEGRAALLVLQVHDELLLEVPDAEVQAVRELVRAEMCGAYDLDPPLAVEVGVGENWAEAKSWREN